ncbi:MAG: class I SAM-dependent methyltransferase [Candidatus Hodarchaeales archaeon]|jgi:2-polyprenyl-6-hydroxyphenyl methylase/3-demethylubiquinone-9 3-methyltransferase
MSKRDYYSQKLFANKLKQCYEIASPRIKQYLEAEIAYTLTQIKKTDTVLELGCGYGRVLKRIAEKAKTTVGIDTSESSLHLAKIYLKENKNVKLYQMDARSLEFKDEIFDLVVAIQNGISSFKVDPPELIKESLRITKVGGRIILSSYSRNIWKARLEWFIRQSEEGLLGEINYEKTKNGVIECKDGFKATTYTIEEFTELISRLSLTATVTEVDNSSVFCIIQKKSNKI